MGDNVVDDEYPISFPCHDPLWTQQMGNQNHLVLDRLRQINTSILHLRLDIRGECYSDAYIDAQERLDDSEDHLRWSSSKDISVVLTSTYILLYVVSHLLLTIILCAYLLLLLSDHVYLGTTKGGLHRSFLMA